FQVILGALQISFAEINLTKEKMKAGAAGRISCFLERFFIRFRDFLQKITGSLRLIFTLIDRGKPGVSLDILGLVLEQLFIPVFRFGKVVSFLIDIAQTV